MRILGKVLFLTNIFNLIESQSTSPPKFDSMQINQDDKIKFCGVFEDVNYWNLIKWYLATKHLEVTEILNSTEHDTPMDITGEILKRLGTMEQPIMLRVIDNSLEERVTFASTYSWSGHRLACRTNCANQTFIRTDRVYRHSHLLMTTTFHLIISRSVNLLNEYIVGYPRHPFQVSYGNLIFITMDLFQEMSFVDWKKTSEYVLEKLWKDYGLINTIFLSPCMFESVDEHLIGYYDPFEKQVNTDGKVKKWGTVDWKTTNEIPNMKSYLNDKLTNFKGYPLVMSVFRRMPTALRTRELPRNYMQSKLLETSKMAAKDYGGFDGIILGSMAIALNFEATVIPPSDKIEYGYKLDNGTFTGTLGDVLYRRADVSFNGRFIKSYDSEEIDFIFPVYFDKLCIIAPKALIIPQWLAIFLCFNITVWLIIITFNFLCGYVWYLLKKWATKKVNEGFVTIKDHEHYSIEYNRLIVATIEMWMIMLASPSAQMPFRTTERFFMTACLLSNLIIAGTFQGSLTTSFSTTTYYKDINSLESLDRSGLPIGTSSKSLMDIFGENRSSTLESVFRKYRLITNETTMYRAAYKRDICCVERFADIKLIINQNYLRSDGTPMLHTIDECPRSYYLAYVVKRGWPFLKKTSMIIRRFLEAGLLEKWYDSVEESIILQTKYSKPPDDVGNQAFSLVDMQTAFYILLFGVVLCLCTFLGEVIVRAPVKWRKRKAKLPDGNFKVIELGRI